MSWARTHALLGYLFLGACSFNGGVPSGISTDADDSLLDASTDDSGDATPADADVACALDFCTDGILNCGETGTDCGGPCGGCADGEGCLAAEDCLTGECVVGTCDTVPGCNPKVNYRSVGVNAGILADQGTVSTTEGTSLMTFTNALPQARSVGGVGLGDEITIGDERYYVIERVSSTELSVQPNPDGDSSGSSYEIRRAYNTVSAWETARGGDLVDDNTRERAILYGDGVFSEPTISINGSVTDSCNFMWVSAARGHRHQGVATNSSTGSVVFKPAGEGHVFEVSDDYFRATWLEISAYTGFSSEAFRVNSDRFLLAQSIVHDALGQHSDGIHTSSSNITFEVYNSIFYNLGRMAVMIQDCSSNGSEGNNVNVRISNSTIYNMGLNTTLPFEGGIGFSDCGNTNAATTGSVISATNTYSHSSVGMAFAARSGGTFANGGGSNASHDASAPGTPTLINSDPALHFVSLTDDLDLHLLPTSLLINSGVDLSAAFRKDIDGVQRLVPWDVGADER